MWARLAILAALTVSTETAVAGEPGVPVPASAIVYQRVFAPIAPPDPSGRMPPAETPLGTCKYTNPGQVRSREAASVIGPIGTLTKSSTTEWQCQGEFTPLENVIFNTVDGYAKWLAEDRAAQISVLTKDIDTQSRLIDSLRDRIQALEERISKLEKEQ